MNVLPLYVPAVLLLGAIWDAAERRQIKQAIDQERRRRLTRSDHRYRALDGARLRAPYRERGKR